MHASSLTDRRSQHQALALSPVDGPHAPGNHQAPQISCWTSNVSSEQGDGLVAPRVHQRSIQKRRHQEGRPVSRPSGTSECLFCKIITGDVPARRIDEDDHSFAFLDIAPFHRGHTLVVPKRHVDSFLADPPALAEITPAIDRVSRLLTQRLDADGINLFASAGAVAGQEVFHLHVHLVPRYADTAGLRNLFGPKPLAPEEELEAVWQQLNHR
ncbi:MAG: HIT family protein [Microlunatus sp.]|nr:HIT family protein [Microlunatus sp.]